MAANRRQRIRVSWRDVATQFISAGFMLLLALQQAISAYGSPVGVLCLVTVAALNVVAALYLRSRGVVLTPQAAVVKGVRTTLVPWSQVQAVLRQRWLMTDVVVLLTLDKSLRLRAPTAWFGFGDDEYERDYHRIGQWWLAHRGDAWVPLRPEAPPAAPAG
ncbi:hypothetical protein CLV35_2637 [Motilibacter peucedani]|uniref:Uncharacterized protein n=1 Tax=Motilibacter peucedani TaxID=598650 RepID=A0A420XPN0_9ACTN|nr:hypothetical protein [Motilibacter peucedani]RKS74135.1 hypothetical protein CLV35_2637 [Motilibacter peucedani]